MTSIIRFGNSVDCFSVAIQHFTFNVIELGSSSPYSFQISVHRMRFETMAQRTFRDACHPVAF